MKSLRSIKLGDAKHCKIILPSAGQVMSKRRRSHFAGFYHTELKIFFNIYLLAFQFSKRFHINILMTVNQSEMTNCNICMFLYLRIFLGFT